MLFSPLSGMPDHRIVMLDLIAMIEIPSLGRNGFYVWPMLACSSTQGVDRSDTDSDADLLLQVGAPLTESFTVLLVLRFFTGLMVLTTLLLADTD